MAAMTELFLKLLNMSISASWLVAVVLLLRQLLKRTPKWITCVLWSIVALRLVFPFFAESPLSLIPSAEVIPQNIVTSQTPAIHSGIPAVNSVINPVVTQRVMEQETILAKALAVAAAVWAVGAAVMILYGVFSWLLLRYRVKASVLLRENVYLCDNVESPFVFGFFRPRIYMPSGMEEEQISYVLAHEKAHIRRGDHCWKPLSFWLLAVYWFNPLLWVAYILLCRDIEQACDEKVIADMDNANKKGYSQALVACSVHRRMIMACPVAFGEIGIKTRIKGVLSYKKPTVWILAAALVICCVTAVCFLTNPQTCQHNYQGQVTVAATCTEKGMETRTCTLCQHSYTVPVEVLAHSYDDGVVTAAPTCIAQGTLERSCTGCGAKKTESIPMTAHIDGEHRVSKEANCVEKGEVTTTCTYCAAVYVVEILPENGVHDLTETVITQSTCTQNGEGIKTCTRCDHSETVIYELKEHNFKYYRSDPASCSYTGEKIYVCTECNAVDTEKIPKNGEHAWMDNMYSYHCILCGASKAKNSNNSNNSSNRSWLDDVFSSNPSMPELPVVKWDIADDMSPKP